MTETEFATVRKARMALRDPAVVNNLIFADSVPEEPDTQAGYYIAGSGIYKKFNERRNDWETLKTKLSDVFIIETVNEKGFNRALIILIDFIIMGLQSEAVSFRAGAESVTKAGLSEQLELYRERRKILLEQAGLNTGRTIRTRRPVIGGVYE